MLFKSIRISSILFCLFLALFACNSSNGESAKNDQYTISGKVENVDTEKDIILSKYDPRNQSRVALDTARMEADGQYQLNYTFEEPAFLELSFFRKQKVQLIIDEGQSNVALNVEGVRNGKVEIIGSKDSELLLAYEAFRTKSFNRLVRPAYKAMDAAEEKDDVQAEVDAVETYAIQNEIHRTELIDYAKKNIGTSLALYGTMLRWTGDDNIVALDELVSAFEKAHPDIYMATEMRDKVERFKKVAVGVIAPDISLKDPEGNVLSLSDVDAEYVLIDFWASWCGPCILQVPDLQKAYTEFKDQGFEIYSVSVDSKEKSWKKDIEKHQLDNWLNVSDLKGWGSVAANDYNVTFIPYNFLVDKDRKIIAKNLHSKSLQGKLEELIGN